jgi:hypothetical protein
MFTFAASKYPLPGKLIYKEEVRDWLDEPLATN